MGNGGRVNAASRSPVLHAGFGFRVLVYGADRVEGASLVH